MLSQALRMQDTHSGLGHRKWVVRQDEGKPEMCCSSVPGTQVVRQGPQELEQLCRLPLTQDHTMPSCTITCSCGGAWKREYH